MKKCKYSSDCGGCAYIEDEYEKQLKIKQKQAEQLIRPFGKVLPIIGMDNPFNYRNKVHAVIAGDKKGNIYAGTYKAGTHHVVSVKECLLDNKKADAIINTIVSLMKSFKYQPYNEDTKRGFMRHILIRTSDTTGQIMVVLVIGDPCFPSKNNFVKALLKEHPEITTIVMNINNKKTGMILGEREQIIYGKGYIEDVLLGHRFKISSKSFYQVNHVQTEVLYNTAISYAGLMGKEAVLDAYCGTGTIGICAALAAGSVTGVELNPVAVKDAIYNAGKNKINNIKFIQGDAGEFMEKEAYLKSRYDVVFMDPPRAGSDEKFLSSLVKLNPSKVVYISCNPETLARDLKYLKKRGYNLIKCQPVDMFCWTDNIEAVCLLSNRN
ncbi:MAG: 23S rRNA (uracil(1939)-C(5))-methyltransferase RlmD [Butyrivibrio sp.]